METHGTSGGPWREHHPCSPGTHPLLTQSPTPPCPPRRPRPTMTVRERPRQASPVRGGLVPWSASAARALSKSPHPTMTVQECPRQAGPMRGGPAPWSVSAARFHPRTPPEWAGGNGPFPETVNGVGSQPWSGPPDPGHGARCPSPTALLQGRETVPSPRHPSPRLAHVAGGVGPSHHGSYPGGGGRPTRSGPT